MQTFLDSRHLAHEKELDRFPVVTLPDTISPRTARGSNCVLTVCQIKSELLQVSGLICRANALPLNPSPSHDGLNTRTYSQNFGSSLLARLQTLVPDEPVVRQ
jgi:hypothetical protein